MTPTVWWGRLARSPGGRRAAGGPGGHRIAALGARLADTGPRAGRSRRELEIVVPPVPLAVGRGRERLFELAERAGITLVD
jgi:hypothetical protein